MKRESKERMLKLIWDFKGPDSARTAEHHALHLKEFIKMNNLSPKLSGFENIAPEHHIAYLVISESEMPAVRDSLKPHRGQLYQQKS
jgi:DNA polymerase II small subunit/DNA polymerase delta subunit B